jgi:hypothetical protein
MIPRRIIQTGKTKVLSPLMQASVANLKLLHPEWEYLYFDDEDIMVFVGTEFPEYEAVMAGFPNAIQRIDFFRYLAVYRLGGFYFDLDVFLSKSLLPLLDAACVFPFEELTLNRYLSHQCDIDWEIGNYAFGAEAGHPFLGAVIENCVRAQQEPAWLKPMREGIPLLFRSEFEVLNSTGPGLLTRTLAERAVTAADMTILFPPDVCDPAQWHLFGDYGVHMMDGSWRSQASPFHRRILCWWESRARSRTLPGSRRLGAKRSLASRRADTADATPELHTEDYTSELAEH